VNIEKDAQEQVFALNFSIDVLKAFKVVALDEEYLLFYL